MHLISQQTYPNLHKMVQAWRAANHLAPAAAFQTIEQKRILEAAEQSLRYLTDTEMNTLVSGSDDERHALVELKSLDHADYLLEEWCL